MDNSRRRMAGLIALAVMSPQDAGVLNGIAPAPGNDQRHVTGQQWPKP